MREYVFMFIHKYVCIRNAYVHACVYTRTFKHIHTQEDTQTDKLTNMSLHVYVYVLCVCVCARARTCA